MAKITTSERSARATVKVSTKPKEQNGPQGHSWWRAKSQKELASQLVETASFLKEQQGQRQRQASLHARMYGNIPLQGLAGSNMPKLAENSKLPIDRPTMNVVQSCVDTLVSRLCQSKPKPLFLTDGGDYKSRTLAKQMNDFIAGELHQTKAYELAETALRDAAILGTGCMHLYETDDNKIGLERVLATEMLVDANDAFYGEPRTIYRVKLVDRSVLAELFDDAKAVVTRSEQAYPDSSDESARTMSDQVMIVEGWHLPSGKTKDAKGNDVAHDGRHVIATTAGILRDEPYTKDDFPFVFLPYAPRLVGFWAQGLAEQLMGTQIEINKLLITISRSISLVGVPRVFVEDGSKVVKAHLNNEVGSIVTYRGTKPEYEVAPCVPAELYQQLQRLIEYAYQQSGISALSATSQKPAGLNSGEAIRSFDDLQSDRFASLNKRYDNTFVKLSYKIIDMAADIAKRDGKYQTVFPNKDGTKQIDLPDADKLAKDPFIVQCFDSNALPKDPAGRKQAIVEDMQSGILSLQEGRRLLNYSDLEQDDKLAMAAEERILKVLDAIVQDGKFEPPDPMTDIQLGKQKVVQYYNLYIAHGLEESKAQMLRDWQAQLLELEQAAMPPMPMGMPGGSGVPGAPPTAELAPTKPQVA